MISHSFTDVGVSGESVIKAGQRATYRIGGTYTGTVVLERVLRATTTQSLTNTAGATVTATDVPANGVIENTTNRDMTVRFRSTAAMTGTATAVLTDLIGATNPFGVGAAAGTGVTALEQGDERIHKTTLFFDNVPMTLADATVGAGLKVYDFPEGRISILGAVGTIQMATTSTIATTLNSGVTCKWGVGSTTQVSATLATTEQNIIPVTTLVSSTTINVPGALAPAQLAAALQLDGTATPVDAFLNISVPTATDIDADATVLVSGSVTITWMNLGDL